MNTDERSSILCAALGTSLAIGLPAPAGTPRAMPPGQVPKDIRLQPLKDLNGYFPFAPAKSPEEWATRAERVRRQILVTEGLWPAPTRTPLNAVIHGKVERPDYTVEKVYFESVPGFYVSGSLYRPKGKNGRLPAVLCPHGHWADGRFVDEGLDATRQEIAHGAERFEEGGRSVLQAICVGLARMGCVVFHYDMIGHADSMQIPMSVAHGFAKQRPEMNTVENWGLFSPQAEAHFQSVMGLQTWNSIRSLDFLIGLPDVDESRIAVTGGSGGGTQTFILCAIDPRPAVAFPAVMVSTAMQGGCPCENACGLRIGSGNVEFAALFAPKPLGLTSADDWTREMSVKGFPELKRHYALLGAPDNVMLKRGEKFGHNYNYESRAAMHAWLNTHLKIGLAEPIAEQDYTRLTRQELSVWDDHHPPPAGGPEFECRLLRQLDEDGARQLRQAQAEPVEFLRVYGGALDVVLGRNLSEVGDVVWSEGKSVERDGYVEKVGLIGAAAHQEVVPAVVLDPKRRSGQTVIWITDTGKAGLFAERNGTGPAETKPEIRMLIEAGCTVIGVDLLFQGEFLGDGKPVTKTRRVANPREAAAYTFGYNHALFAQRVHDILTLVKFAGQWDPKPKTVAIAGLGGAGPWVAAACAQARGAVERAAVDTGGFRFGQLLDVQDVNFLPGGAKYGDLPGMLAVAAPMRLWLAGEGREGPELVRKIYAETPKRTLSVFAGNADEAREEAVKWLLEAPARPSRRMRRRKGATP